jgi:hypothetical protein
MSAFTYEQMFAILRSKFEVGTRNPVKQIIQGVLNRYRLSHTCMRTGQVKMKRTTKSDDRLFYTFNVMEGYRFFCARKVRSDYVSAYEMHTLDSDLADKCVPWKSVGVKKFGGITNRKVSIDKTDIKGKVVVVGNHLVTLPNNVLVETY